MEVGACCHPLSVGLLCLILTGITSRYRTSIKIAFRETGKQCEIVHAL
jgi:hypothetical protein